MSTSFGATTVTINEAFCLQTDSLHERDIPKAKINMEIFRSLPPDRQETICPSIYMRSRGAWAMDMAYRLCRLAKIDNLLFLSGTKTAPTGTIIQILEDDEDEEQESAHIAKYGFLIDKPIIQEINKEIDRLFEWSLENIDRLAAHDLMGYFATKEDILEAIKNPIIFKKLSLSPGSIKLISVTDQIKGFEDGDGPWYFYSWLRSVQQVLKTASIFSQKVLHIVDNSD